MTDTRSERLERVNKLIECIASCGRRFFHDRGHGVARFAFQGKKLWYMDEYRGAWMYTGVRHLPRTFSHGSSLEFVVLRLARFIRAGEKLNSWLLSPENHWGYDDDMVTVQARARELRIVELPEVTHAPEADGWITVWPLLGGAP